MHAQTKLNGSQWLPHGMYKEGRHFLNICTPNIFFIFLVLQYNKQRSCVIITKAILNTKIRNDTDPFLPTPSLSGNRCNSLVTLETIPIPLDGLKTEL